MVDWIKVTQNMLKTLNIPVEKDYNSRITGIIKTM